MYSARQLHYLEKMGIPAWIPREHKAGPATASAPEAAEALDSGPQSLAQWLLPQPLQQIAGRPDAVFTQGRANSALLILSDCLSGQSAAQQAFPDAAGKMLDAMLKAIGQSRGSCLLAALADAAADSGSDLQSVLSAHSPAAILFFTRPEAPGARWLDPQQGAAQDVAGAQCIVSYHPRYLLQHADLKRRVWEDLKTVRRLLG